MLASFNATCLLLLRAMQVVFEGGAEKQREKLHDRMFYELRCVEFSVAWTRVPGESTRVHLLNSRLYRSCWKNYVETPAF
jgi:hypothetical protein